MLNGLRSSVLASTLSWIHGNPSILCAEFLLEPCSYISIYVCTTNSSFPSLYSSTSWSISKRLMKYPTTSNQAFAIYRSSGRNSWENVRKLSSVTHLVMWSIETLLAHINNQLWEDNKLHFTQRSSMYEFVMYAHGVITKENPTIMSSLVFR